METIESRKTYIQAVKTLKPRHESTQQASLEWLAKAHAQSDKQAAGLGDAARYLRWIERVGCSPKQISSRAHELEDFLLSDWDKMKIFRLGESPQGLGMGARNTFFSEASMRVFELFYKDEDKLSPPDDLIHVTCTGYSSPSPAQRLVSTNGWAGQTTVTHAYHMGCYAAVPALRQAVGFLASSGDFAPRMLGRKSRVDIVHTELCSLHLDPSKHSPEQFVVQSLFADGFAKYSVVPGWARDQNKPSLELLSVREEVVPDTEDAMSWLLTDWGMGMTLSKDVPGLIAKGLRSFVERLGQQVGFSVVQNLGSTVFAVHPGGPKILDRTCEILELEQKQIQASRDVLYERGNMSSATLPHIWERIVNDPTVPHNTIIVSLAFGPGLTLCGALMRKQC
jgi:predicted naringenin-chalcone synthase